MKMVEFKSSNWDSYDASLFLKVLSDSHLSNADLIIRESIQNSYDARAKMDIPVDFKIKGFYLNNRQKDFFTETLPTNTSETARKLVQNLRKDNIYCLEIRDSNSTGLNGPFQPYDEITQQEIDSSKNNYRDFVFKMGATKEHTKGGSFGVGKTSLFLVSNVKTVCIYSRTIYENEYQSRFIIKSFYPYSFDDKEITQYWFSKERPYSNSKNMTCPLPFLGEDADYIAKNIGMEGYGPKETGTAVLILDVDFNKEEDGKINPREYFCSEFPKKIEHWFWTKLSYYCDAKKKINISIWDDEEELELSKPEDVFSPYFPLFRCLQLWDDGYSKIENLTEKEKIKFDKVSNFIPINTNRPTVMLGAITFVKIDKKTELMDTFFSDGDYNLCLARMRNVEFCMQYQLFKFPQIEQNKVVFALFHTDPKSWDGGSKDTFQGAVDAAFRKAENKTHDEWVVESVQDRDRTYVKQGILKIKSSLEEIFGNKDNVVATQDVSSNLSLAMGRFLPYGAGFGASLSIGSNTASQTKKAKQKISLPPFKTIGVPLFFGNGWRRIKCSFSIKEPIQARGRVFPVVGTVEGNLIKDVAANNRVIIKQVTFGPNEQEQRIAVRFDSNTIPLNKVGCFVFELDVFGDIGFDLRIEMV